MAETSRREERDRDARLPVRNWPAATSEGAAALEGSDDAVADASPSSEEPDVVAAPPRLSKDKEASDGAVVSLVTGAIPVGPSALNRPATSEAPPEPGPLGFST